MGTILADLYPVLLLQAQAYLGVFYMRGLQPKVKKGLKYLLLAAKNGVSNLCANYDCAQLRISVGYRWQILGLLGNGSECRDFTALSVEPRCVLERRQALGNRDAETALLGWGSSHSTSACVSLA